MTQVAAAVAALASGGLVAFPTETVFGLGCLATSAAGRARFYAAKRRPEGQPAVLMAPGVEALRRWVELDEAALALAAEFWPGPLTLVLRGTPAAAELAQVARAGTLAARVPDHPVALELLRAVPGPLATSSANRQGETPATTAAAAARALGDEVDVVLEGECPGQPPSSILDLTRDPPVILRQGPIPAARLLR